MSVNMVAQWVINSIGPLGVAGALLPVFLLYAAVGWILFTLSIWRHNDFVRPRLGRS
jgi:hypothetical protein